MFAILAHLPYRDNSATVSDRLIMASDDHYKRKVAPFHDESNYTLFANSLDSN